MAPPLAAAALAMAIGSSFAVRKFELAPVVAPRPRPVHASNKSYTPVVLMHGLGDASSNPGMQSLGQSIQTAYPGIHTVVAPVADSLLSFFTPIQTQVDEFAAVVRADPLLAGGFSVVGLSQGGLVVRGYVEQYNDPPVKNLVSICGIQGGEYACPLEIDIIPFLCALFESNPYEFLFNGSIPLSFSDYWVTYDNQQEYLSGNKYLPYLNNEVMHANSSAYKQRILSLNRLALIQATEDTVVYPYQAEQFGGYAWNSKNATVFTFAESVQYQQDLIGLATLFNASKIDFKEFAGDHLRFNDSFWDSEVLPYFDN